MRKPLHILILEDRTADAELLTRALREAGFEFVVRQAATEPEFLAGLREHAPHLILADYSLPGYDGLAALAAAQKQCPETPFIFVSGSLGDERAVDTLLHGATDYVLKDRLARLGPAVRRALREREETRKRQQAEQEQLRAEARYRALFEQSPDGIVILDPQTSRPLEFNATAHRQLGYSREEFAQLSLADIEAIETPEQTRATIEGVRRVGVKDFETRHRTREGQIRHVHVTAQIVEASGRSVYHCIWRDITARQQAEQRVRELNLVLRASGAINALMVRERDPERLLAEACKILVETRGYVFAWIGQVEAGSRRVVPAASAGKGAGYLEGINVTWDQTPAGQGPIGTAIRTGQPMSCQDTAIDPQFALWKEAAMARGFASVAAMPMIHGSRVLGAVAVYSEHAGAFHAEEIALLRELANDLAFALVSIEDGQERKRAEGRLRLLSAALESTANAVAITDREGLMLWANRAFTQLTGYSLQEVCGQKPSLLKSGAHDQAFYQQLWQTVLAGRVWSAEMSNRRKDGSLYTEDCTITPVRDELGEITHFIAVKQDVTERKRAEEELRAAHAKLNHVLNCTPAVIYTLQLEGSKVTTVFRSENVQRLLGVSVPEALRSNWWLESVHPEDRDRVLSATAKGLAGDGCSLEYRLRHADGTYHWVEDSNRVVRDDTGRPAEAVGVWTDITARKELEAAVVLQEQRFKAFFSGATVGLALLDQDLRYIQVNDALAEMNGVPARDHPGRTVHEVVPQLAAKVLPVLQKVLATGKPALNIEFSGETARTPGVRGHWIESSFPIPGKEGRPVGVGSIVVEITARKQLEEALRESSQFNQQIIASAQEGIIVYGLDLKYQAWNPFMERLTGMPAADVVGKDPEQLFPFLREAGVLASIHKALAGEPVPSTDLHFAGLPGGKAGWVSHTNGPLRNAAGEIIGAIGIVRDITERKQAEEVLRESEQRFRQLAENIESVFWMADAKLDRMLYVSPAYERIWGRPTTSLYEQPKSFMEAIHPEDRARVTANLQAKHLAEPGEFTIEYRVVRPDGSVRWVRDRGFPIMDAAGQLDRMVGIAEDITEWKRAELRIAAFANLGRRLNAAKTAREAGEIIVGVADELLGWDACLFDLYSAAENRVTHVLNMDLIDGRRAECKRQYADSAPKPLSKRTIEQGGQLILRDQPKENEPAGAPFGDVSRPAAAILFVPIRHGTQVVGILSIQSYTPSAYDAYSLETLQALADHGGGALERLRAQEALGESEANFRSVWEHSIDGMRLTDKEGRILAVNEAYCRLVLAREQLEGHLFSVAYKGHAPNEGIAVYQERFATGNISPHNTRRVELWNSQALDLEISSSFFELGQRGKMLLSIFRDVSERRRAEARIAAFSKLGQRLSAAKTAREAAGIIAEVAGELLGWDAFTFGLFSPSQDLLDHVMHVDTINGQRMVTSPGYEPPSALARRILEEGAQLILKDDPDRLLPGARPFGDASRPSASIAYVPVRNGAEVVGVVSIQSYTPKAYDARSLETLQALADHCGGAIDRLRMQAAWQTSEQRLGHLLTQSPAVIYSLKTDGATTEPAWVSDNVERLLGYTVAECCGPEGLFKRLRTQDRQDAIDGLVQLLAKKQIARDYRVRHKNGKDCWVRDEQRLVCDEAGAPVEIVGSWVDITEHKAVEELLRQSQKMDAVGQLAGGVAHDFNNMLAIIRGNAELLLMDAALYSAETREGLTHVVEASERAAKLTRQLLAFSRKQVLQPQPLVLNEVIATLTKMLKRVIGENIDLQCRYAAPLPYVHADPGMMEQVLLNLVVNARDAMPAGGQLRIATAQAQIDEGNARANLEARVGEFVCLSVSDTGAGIAPDVLPRIFEPFYTTKEIGKGTGLGLATVYGIVQQHQGWIEVSSQVGEGSTFTIFLPTIPPPTEPAATADAGAQVRGGTETILLVEDDSAVRLATRRLLESKGYRIREAATAREGLEQWRRYSGEIALLLTDIMLPERMTGRDLAEQLWARRPGLKVIFLSGYSAEVMGKSTEFIRKTGSHFLQKPCSTHTLLQTVRRCLDERRSVAASNQTSPVK